MMTLVALLIFVVAQPGREVRLERVGWLDEPAIREASGIVRSRKHEGVFWVHNDSGNSASLFAVRRDGSLIRAFSVGVPNVDWEDIGTDDAGHLYIGDIGNNGSLLPLRAVYRLDEPDPFREEPASEKKSPPLAVSTACYYRFASGKAFDAEGLFVDGNKVFLVSKTFDARDAEVYAIPFDRPAPLLRPAKPERVGTLDGFTSPVTGASLSADGKRLAVCSLGSVGVYHRKSHEGWKRVAIRAFRVEDQVEAIAWDGDDLILAGENRGVYRLKSSDWLEPERAPKSGKTR